MTLKRIAQIIVGFLLAAVMAQDCYAQSASSQKSLIVQFLDFWGLTRPPRSGERAGAPQPGELWVVELPALESKQVAPGSTFATPVYLPDGDIVAIRNDEIVRIPSKGGEPVRVLAKPGELLRLLAAHKSDSEQILVQHKDHPAVLDLETGYTKSINAEGNIGPERTYGDVHLVVLQAKVGQDIYWMKEDGSLTKITNCDPDVCDQPSLSFDKSRAAFVRR